MALILLIVFVSLALSVSFLCSILEAALLSTREMELSRRAEEGDKAARRLLDIKRDRLDDAISGILTLNTIAHTVGSTMAGAQAAIVFGDKWLGVFSGVLTLAVLLLTEIIPKTIGTVFASRLVGFVGLLLVVIMKLLSPVLFLTRLITRMFTSASHEQQISGRELAALVSVAARQGHLKQEVSATLANVLRFDEIKVEDVMTPRTVTKMLAVDATVEDLIAGPNAFSRIPLYRQTRDQVEGYVLVREVLASVAHGAALNTSLSEYLRGIRRVPQTASLSSLLQELLAAREHIALVMGEFGGMAGLVTLEDVVETLLGREILDELDTVADLRQLAKQMRDRRTQRNTDALAANEPPAPAAGSDNPPA